MPSQALAPHFGDAARTESSAASASGATCTIVATARAPSAIARPLQRRRHVALQPDRIVQQQSPASPHLDDIAQRCPFDHLAHRGAAEHQTFHAEKPRVLGKFDAQMAAHGAAIEQDGLLWQPLGRAALRHGDPRAHARRGTARQRSIEPLRRLRRDRRARLRPDGNRGVQHVAAGNAARCVQRDHMQPRGIVRSGKPRLQTSHLTQFVQHRAFATLFQRHRKLAERPLQTDRFRAERDIVHRSAANAGRCRATARPDRPAKDAPPRLIGIADQR